MDSVLVSMNIPYMSVLNINTGMISVHTLISVFKKLNTALILNREQIENI